MLNNKIKNILLVKDMSPSRFADEIGVQRSSISHILSGRNKPSLEIIQKIVKRFPELGLDWIIDEEEPAEEENTDEISTGKMTNIVQEKLSALNAKSVDSKPGLMPTADNEELPSKRKVEKILIFYSDKTFTEYKPE